MAPARENGWKVRPKLLFFLFICPLERLFFCIILSIDNEMGICYNTDKFLERSKGDNMPTIEDVARAAGVSRSTVSLVLNKSPLVRETTKRRVEEAIAELNYVPNNNARGLSSRITNALGVLFMQDFMPSMGQVTYDNDQHVGLCSFNISNGIMNGLIGTRYGVIMERFCSVNAPDELPRMIQEKRVDGVFVVGHPYSEAFLQNLRETGIPFVMVGVGSYEEGIDSIYADPVEGTLIAVRELLRTGHRRICLMNCSAMLLSHERRLQAYRMALEESGLPFDESWNICAKKNNGRSAYEVFCQFWEAGNRPDAIVAANGQSASGIMSFLYRQGVCIPDDLSIIAYEDSSICGYATPALTAVNIRKEELGFEAAKCLIDRIRHPDKPVTTFVAEPYLVRRESVRER